MAVDIREDGKAVDAKLEPDYEPREPEEPHYIAPETPRPKRKKPMHAYPKTQAGKMWDAFYNPEDPVNTLGGGMINSAGGRPPEVTWRDAFKFGNFRPDGITKVHQIPCGRDALLVGIGTGGAVAGTRFVLTGLKSMLVTCNWGVGAFTVGAMGMYTWCEQRRRKEQQGIAMALMGMKMLNDKKRREEAETRAAQAAAEEERLRQDLANKKWYIFW